MYTAKSKEPAQSPLKQRRKSHFLDPHIDNRLSPNPKNNRNTIAKKSSEYHPHFLPKQHMIQIKNQNCFDEEIMLAKFAHISSQIHERWYSRCVWNMCVNVIVILRLWRHFFCCKGTVLALYFEALSQSTLKTLKTTMFTKCSVEIVCNIWLKYTTQAKIEEKKNKCANNNEERLTFFFG